ncbi:PspC domain-containing protein [Demequina iriomotensis]|uniref:PspC domain-containing protein n=1 Tax=Demequina iriomotensis TaxID=1536641 RepID=UPI00078336E5|nr:PspC domain-containing protein [Demequina iriomotensis]
MTDQQTPPTEAGFFTTIRGWELTRSDARVFSGVGAGIAERLGWSRAWTRVGLVGLAIVLNGIVLLAYAAAWALLPDRRGRIIAQDFGRGVPNVGALVAIAVVGLVGLATIGEGGPWSWNHSYVWDDGVGGGVFRMAALILGITIPLAVIGGIVFLVVHLARRGGTGGATPPQPGPDGAPPVYAAPPAWAAARQQARADRQARRDERATYRAGVAEDAVASASAAADAAASQAQSAAAAATGYAQPYGAPAYAAPPVPPVPPRAPRVPGPGAPFYLLTLAWLVLSGAGVAAAAWQDRLAVHPMLAWFAVFLTGVGVILVLVALSGRRLGFLAFASALMMVPALALTAEAEDVRDGWADRHLPEIRIERDGDEITRIEIGDGGFVLGEPAPEESVASAAPEPSYDALAAFDGDYALISLPSGCYALDEVPGSEGQSRGLISETALDSTTTADVTAGYTTVRVAAGTSLEVTTGESASASVYWPDRGITCEVWSGASVSLANPGDPVLTLDATHVAEGYSTIVIEEVAS